MPLYNLLITSASDFDVYLRQKLWFANLQQIDYHKIGTKLDLS